MERDFLLPDVGEGLEDATIVLWHVQVGDTVHLNDPLVTIETAKAAVELPSPFEGRVLLLNAAEGDELRVGDLLARIESPDHAAAPTSQVPGMAPSTSPRARPEPSDGSSSEPPDRPVRDEKDRSSKRRPVLVGYGVDDRRRPASRHREWQRPKTPGEHVDQPGDDHPGAVSSPRASPEDPSSPPTRPLAKPPVRWLARTLDVDLRRVPATGTRGEVTEEDVRTAAGSSVSGQVPASSDHLREGERAREDGAEWWSPGSGTPRAVRPRGASSESLECERPEEIPVRGVRARIAERMSVSRSTIPDATCGLWVDCERLLALRSALRDDAGRETYDPRGAESITPFAVLAWMVPSALQTAPLLNATFDAEAKVIRVHRAVHLGIATNTKQGLLVPVVHGAHGLGLREFASELARLTSSAREGSLTPAELTGSTFTVTNYGALGLDDGNPVINAPEAAILGVGTIAPRATVHGGELAVRATAKLICAFDHRISDGAEAARFLRRLKALVEQPELLLGTR